MCGRITLTSPAEVVAELFGLAAIPTLAPRYNMAPTQQIPAVRGDENGVRTLDELRWGLIPYGAKDPAVGNRMINARAESISDRPAFRWAFYRRRCLIAVSGFYEWRGTGKLKQAYLVRRRDGAPFGLAAIWDVWRQPDGPKLETCAIVTCTANALMRPIHDRMPVIIPRPSFGRWLDPASRDRTMLEPLLASPDDDSLDALEVGSHVNDPRNDDARCVEPLRSAR